MEWIYASFFLTEAAVAVLLKCGTLTEPTMDTIMTLMMPPNLTGNATSSGWPVPARPPQEYDGTI